MRFLCDHMLLGVGHWLRIAGYDTAFASPDDEDRALVEWALCEARQMLTLDRKILEIRGAESCVTVVGSNALEVCAVELRERFDVDWERAPLSRCLGCNAPLVDAGPGAFEAVPPAARESVTQVRRCGPCDKLFWDGSHAQSMLAKLRALNTLT